MTTNGGQRKGMAIASLVLGILSIPTLGLVFVGALVGIVLGVAALVQQGRRPREYGGKGLAIVGIVLCALSFVMIPFVGIIAAIAIPSFLRARVSANESAALGEIRTVISAESSYARQNGDAYGTLECLAQPATCRPAGAAAVPAFLEPVQSPRGGYNFVFMPGPAALAGPRVGPASLTSFALVASPVTRNRTGVRDFCGDSTGRVCETIGREPAVVDGQCVMEEAQVALGLRCAAAEDVSTDDDASAPEPRR